MVKKLVTRTEFAGLAGVSAAAVTKACSSSLSKAVVGKNVDANHPAAKKYVESKTGPRHESPATGVDPLYDEAIAACRAGGRWTANYIRTQLKIGERRAGRILATIKGAGLLDDAGNFVPPKNEPSVRGTAAAKQTKKHESAKKLARQVVNAGSEPEQLEDSGIVEIPEDIQLFADMTLRELIRRFGTDTAFVDWLNATQKIEMINEKRLKNAQTEGELIARELVKRGVIDPIDGVFTKMLTDGVKTISSKVHAKVKAGGSVDDVKKVVEDQLASFIRPVKVKMNRTLRDA